MDKIIIFGGKRLTGSITISGSKNSALPILIATLLTDEACVIENVPNLADIRTTLFLLEYLGKKVEKRGSIVYVENSSKLKHDAPYDLVRKMRASILVMGPLLARLGKVNVSLPGGCAIGARPIDIHLSAFKSLGAKIKLSGGYVLMNCSKLVGSVINFRFPSVGATENILLASVLAKGHTVIKNPAREPEIVDLANALNKMGAKITGAGSSIIKIQGVKKLSCLKHRVIADRIECATYMIASAITGGDVILKEAHIGHMRSIIEKLKKVGVKFENVKDGLRVKATNLLKAVSIKTGVYPAFPTDVQAQWMALLSVANGKADITEMVFENRFLHAVELQRLGANIKIEGNKVLVSGVKKLSGAPVMVSDLRAGAALVLAGLVAQGKTEVNRIYHLDRGYEKLEVKLRKLGANIKRVSV
ncbi:MAG: UDP-N-acetylglucosamine 1-carboxyvinyltransferase [Endomicrobiales bacterium]|nr:UDP-N-acetylglucosamine 1-carboxyvinyltransferase [Endomicrobiales bacterium]